MPENTACGDVIIESRKKATFSGISDVESFDEQEILAGSACGDITIKGSALKICRLCVESGDMTVEGKIDSVTYDDVKQKSSFLGKIFG